MSSGSVYDDCNCSPGELMNLTLPSYCYSPTGTDCDWYEDCLEKQYSCENTEAADTIKFSKVFCDLYTDHYDKFSSIGESWVDHVRRCMQVQLAPILHPANQQTYQSLKEMALKSHFPCFLKLSANSTVSFYNLPMKDRWTVFWTVKGAMLDKTATSIKWLFTIISYCNTSHDQNHLRKFTLTFERDHLGRRKRTPAQFNWTTQHETEIGNTLANSRMWKEKGVVWYAVAIQSQKNNDTNYEIGMVIAEQKMYDLNYIGVANANLTIEMDEISEEVKRGNLTLIVNGYHLNITEIRYCYGLVCNYTYVEVGTTQSSDVDECLSRPCQNNGTCIDRINHYVCDCSPGYNDINCENNINECASYPCHNNGSCIDMVNSYECSCKAGFNGTHCQIDVTSGSSSCRSSLTTVLGPSITGISFVILLLAVEHCYWLTNILK